MCEAAPGALSAEEGAEVHSKQSEDGLSVARRCSGLSVSNMNRSNHTGSAEDGAQVSCKAARRSSAKVHLPPQRTFTMDIPFLSGFEGVTVLSLHIPSHDLPPLPSE